AWARLDDDTFTFHQVIPVNKKWSDLIHCDGESAYFATNMGADRGHIVAWKLTGKPGAAPRIVVPECADIISPWIKSARNSSIVANGELFVTYLQHGQHRIRRFDLDGKRLGEVELPCAVTVSGLNPWDNGEKIIINAQSFVLPPS